MIKKLVNYDSSDEDSDVGNKPNVSKAPSVVTENFVNKRKINLAEVPLLRVSKLLKTVENSNEHILNNADDLEDAHWRPSTLEEVAKAKTIDSNVKNSGLPKKLVLSEPKHNNQRNSGRASEQRTVPEANTKRQQYIRAKTLENNNPQDNNEEGGYNEGDEEEEEYESNEEENQNEALNINAEDDPQFVKKSMFFKQEREGANIVVNPINERDVLKEAKQRSERRLADEGLENVRIKTINGNDLLNFDWMSYHQQQKIKKDLNKTPKGLPPSKLQKSKHQLTYLAYEAISKEDELEQRLAEQRLNSRNTNSKYGW